MLKREYPDFTELDGKYFQALDENGDKVKVGMYLRGREKAMGDFAKKKVEFFLQTLHGLIEIKTERELKREPKGFSMIISKK